MKIKTQAEEQILTLSDMAVGLTGKQKSIPAKFLYDEKGSQLFEEITDLPEYYQTRTESEILLDNIEVWQKIFNQPTALIELGSGSSKKTKILLDHMKGITSYVPIDISEEFLSDVVTSLQSQYPEIAVEGISADYTQPFSLPVLEEVQKVVFFPGSTIGNFEPEEAVGFLSNIRSLLQAGDRMIMGVDRKKDRATIEAAYNDQAGVTEAFNKNLLTRMNREFGADFDIDAFDHVSFFNEIEGRIEMHLQSRTNQAVRVEGETIVFRAEERIHTENSYKYDPGDMVRLAKASGFQLRTVVSDERDYFSVCVLEVL
ncbi:L-histidine N(alpha)-methyltransferase [Halobacillus litoralis]|uniref:L-histidine N(alpha)-methyltransferase n=1 Tax=Halobacillus litoralis TaxID=45668 RepID=UPI001CFF40DB|nr:L-histidine N(alpha)-methyltransferase [Halobacillus litoralis]